MVNGDVTADAVRLVTGFETAYAGPVNNPRQCPSGRHVRPFRRREQSIQKFPD
jgi:hypothetical protein